VPRYSPDSKEKVRDAVDMVDLVQTRTELRRAGAGSYMGRCPFHDERTASFSVDAEKKMYHCFGCGVGGDAFRFVQETEGLDFVGALESLASRFGVELEVEDEDPQAAERRRHRERLLELLERAAVFYVRWLWDSAEAEPARAYLAGRGLDEATLREFRVGYAPSAWDKLLMAGREQGYGNRELYDAGLAVRAKGEGRIYDRFRRRIMFPLCDPRGRVLGFGARALGADQQPKYLNSSDGDIFHKGDHVFAAHLARVHATRADRVIACEGYTDVLAFHQAGIRNTVGIMGTALTERQIGELAKLGKTVLLALDADSAGQEAMIRASKVAAGRDVELRVVPLPAGLDPADLVQQQGAEAAKALVDTSQPFVRFRVERELESGDLGSAEGKDHVVEALRPVFAVLPPSALREELLAHVADRLDLAPSLVSSWLPVPGGGGAAGRGRPRANGHAGSSSPSPSAPRPVAANPVTRAERDFLAQCLASPDAAVELLAGIDPEAFSSDGMRRVLAHVRDHLREPQEGLSDDDGVLTRSVAALVALASTLPPSRAVLQAQFLNVRIARLLAEINGRRRDRTGGVAELVRERDTLVQRRDALLQEAMEESAPAD
jgi:DNA primase